MIDQFLVGGVTSGLQSRNISVESRIYDWTEDKDGLVALCDRSIHAHEAEKVAQMIESIRRAHPDDYLLITSHSGGAGIAAWALRRLPADVHVDEWIMIAPALSSYFDLTESLMHVSDRAFSFNSITDMVLGTGTRIFGTVDRIETDAGGRVGFKRPIFGDPLEYAKLSNVPYDPNWLRYGNAGDHIGPMMRPFARVVIAPTAIDQRVPTIPPPAAPTTR